MDGMKGRCCSIRMISDDDDDDTTPRCGACGRRKTELKIDWANWRRNCSEKPPMPADGSNTSVVVAYFCQGPCERGLIATHRKYGYKGVFRNGDFDDE